MGSENPCPDVDTGNRPLRERGTPAWADPHGRDATGMVDRRWRVRPEVAADGARMGQAPARPMRRTNRIFLQAVGRRPKKGNGPRTRWKDARCDSFAERKLTEHALDIKIV